MEANIIWHNAATFVGKARNLAITYLTLTTKRVGDLTRIFSLFELNSKPAATFARKYALAA
jgi:hypothetical protein